MLRNPGRSLGRYLLLPWTTSYVVLGVAAVFAVGVAVYKLVS